MANIKVSELNSTTTVNDNDLFMVVQNGENKKIAKQNFLPQTVTKLWEDNTTTTWDEGTLNIDISGYDFLLIVTSKQTAFVPVTFYTSLTWNGWKESISSDVITFRDIARSGNDINFGKCYYRGIRGNTVFGEAPEIDVPRTVYGFKF